MGRTAEQVYRELAPAVLGYMRSQRVSDPEDLTGDVFVSVTHSLARFRGDDDALRRWVFTIAHHRMIDATRRTSRAGELGEFEPRSPGSDDRPTIDDKLARAVRSLTDEQREVVVLRFVADLPIKDVAAITGRRVGAVKMAQARGLAALKALLDTDS